MNQEINGKKEGYWEYIDSVYKYKVNYRFLDSSSKRGIIKGGIDAAKSESTIDAIVREVAEEITGV